MPAHRPSAECLWPGTRPALSACDRCLRARVAARVIPGDPRPRLSMTLAISRQVRPRRGKAAAAKLEALLA